MIIEVDKSYLLPYMMSSIYFTLGSSTADIYWYLPWLFSPFIADDGSGRSRNVLFRILNLKCHQINLYLIGNVFINWICRL